MILQLFRIVLQKKEQRRLFFFYSEAGILHGKSRAVALQREPLRADDKRRGQQARSICGHRVQSHSQQIRHEVSANGAVQRTICCA